MPERCQLAQFSSVERLLEQTYGSSCGGPALGMAPNSPRRRAPGWPPRRVAAPRLEMTRQGVISSNGSTCASARAARGGWDGRRVRGTHATSRSRLTRLETHGVGSGNPRASGGRRATRRCQHICPAQRVSSHGARKKPWQRAASASALFVESGRPRCSTRQSDERELEPQISAKWSARTGRVADPRSTLTWPDHSTGQVPETSRNGVGEGRCTDLEKYEWPRALELRMRMLVDGRDYRVSL